ncbi:unnamed protein product, partial [Laminaria digitata]
SDAFIGLSHADRLAIVFTALHDGLPATPTPTTATTSTDTNTNTNTDTNTNNNTNTATSTAAAAASNASAYRSRAPSTPGESRFKTPEPTRGHATGTAQPPPTANPDSRPRTVGGPESGPAFLPGGKKTGGGEGGDSEGGGGPGGGGERGVGKGGGGEGGGGERRGGMYESRRRAIRGAVKASHVGVNVEALPVWGGLDAVAGSSLLVDCRTPAQWRADGFQPTPQELWGPARSGHRTLANHPRVKEPAIRSELERIIGESKALREASSAFEHFDRFAEGAGGQAAGNEQPTPEASGQTASTPKTSKTKRSGKRSPPPKKRGRATHARTSSTAWDPTRGGSSWSSATRTDRGC